MKSKSFRSMGIPIAVFLLIAGLAFAPRAQAASVVFDWENGVLDSGARTFTFDILVGDIVGLPDLDGWQLDFDITRQGGPSDSFSFNFVDFSVTPDADYVFLGNSFDYDGVITDLSGGSLNNYNLFIGDLTANGLGVAGPEGMVLATIILDDVEFCNWFTINLDPAGSFFFDSAGVLGALTGSYDIHVVPIPGAVWLLGTGLLCLAGIRRKR